MNDIKRNIRRMFAVICLLFVILVLFLAKFIMVDSKLVVNSPYNPRVRMADASVRRGVITDAKSALLAGSAGGAREYPFGREMAHLVGTAHMGKSGVESAYDAVLRQPSFEILQRAVNLLGGGEVMGDTVVLTADAELQSLLYSAFGQNRGAAVVMEPSTGRVLAMLSKPDFDPATITDDWERLNRDGADSPLLNRAARGLYPPGSVFKPLTAAAALESGLADFTYECTGTAKFNGREIRCFNSRVHGLVDMKEALAVSCNGYFIAAALEMGAEPLIEVCGRAMFNRELPYEVERGSSSFALTAASSADELMETAIGQGQTLVTPLHMCMITSAIANGGRMMKPYVLGKRASATGQTLNRTLPEPLGQVFSPETAAALTGMMTQAAETGTAAPASVPGIAIAAKTGTAENSGGGDHGWVIAFAPAEQPQIAIAVVMENFGGPSGGLEVVRRVVGAAVER